MLTSVGARPPRGRGSPRRRPPSAASAEDRPPRPGRPDEARAGAARAGSTQPKAACTSVTPGSRSSASTSVWSSVGARASGAGVTSSRAGKRVRREAVEPVPARTEEPPELGQRHGGRDVAHLRHPRQGAGARDDRRPAPPAGRPRPAAPPPAGDPRATPPRTGPSARSPASVAPGHEDGQGGEQHRGRGRRRRRAGSPGASPRRGS